MPAVVRPEQADTTMEVSAFKAAAAEPWQGDDCDGSTAAGSTGAGPSRAVSLTPSALSEPSSARPSARSMSRRHSVDVLGRGRGPPQLWRTSTAVADRAASLGYTGVAALCGRTFLPPDRLKRIKTLGEGAFAVVDTAQLLPDAASNSHGPSSTTHTGKLPVVAVKRLKPHVLDSEDDVVAFIQEARLLLKLQHPSIIRYIGLGCDDDSSREAEWRTMYLVQEYATGGTFKKLVLDQMINPRRKLYSLADAVRWGCQLAQGLAFLHQQNPMVLHRDLKAENVLLTPAEDGQLCAKLADFGLHKLVPKTGTSKGADGSEPYRMTGQTGAYVYMAPEVFKMDDNYNEKVDVFSFGVILYELLHRKMIVAELMYLGGTEDAVNFARQVAVGYRKSVDPQLPAALAQLVQGCWADDPSQRPSMAEVVQRLEEVQASGVLEAAELQLGPGSSAQAGCCTIM